MAFVPTTSDDMVRDQPPLWRWLCWLFLRPAARVLTATERQLILALREAEERVRILESQLLSSRTESEILRSKLKVAEVDIQGMTLVNQRDRDRLKAEIAIEGRRIANATQILLREQEGR